MGGLTTFGGLGAGCCWEAVLGGLDKGEGFRMGEMDSILVRARPEVRGLGLEVVIASVGRPVDFVMMVG